jgi:hypothetical protein
VLARRGVWRVDALGRASGRRALLTLALPSPVFAYCGTTVLLTRVLMSPVFAYSSTATILTMTLPSSVFAYSSRRRTPYTDTSVVRVHTSGSSPCLARRRAETNQIKSLRPPTHRNRRHRNRHRRPTTTRLRSDAFAIPTSSRRPHETRQSITTRRVNA